MSGGELKVKNMKLKLATERYNVLYIRKSCSIIILMN